MTSAAPVTDGRVLRGARTRESIVQALLDLLNDGVLTPTAAQIADHAWRDAARRQALFNLRTRTEHHHQAYAHRRQHQEIAN